MSTRIARMSSLALLSVSSLVAQESAKKVKSVSTLPAVRFNWPVPGKVVVTDTVTKRGRTIKLRYTLQFRKAAHGRVRVGWRNFTFLSIDGQDVTGPRYKKVLAPGLDAAAAIADILIAPSGEFERIIGVEDMIERIAVVLSRVRKRSPLEIEQQQRLFRRPQFKELMRSNMQNYWDAWVGAWIAWDIPSGQSTEWNSELPLMGKMLPAKVQCTNHGPVKNRPGYVRLSVRTVAEGKKIGAALQRLIVSLGVPALGSKPGEVKPEQMTFRAESFVQVITKLADLRPLLVKTQKTLLVGQKSAAKPMKNIEQHTYEFDWGKK